MKEHKKRGSVFTLLLQNYIIFTILLVLILTGLFIVYFLKMIGLMIGVDPAQLEKHQDVLDKGAYEEFPVESLIGEDGFIVVLDENNQIKFNSKTEITLPDFNSEDLSCIQPYNVSSEIKVRDLITKEGIKQKAISIRESETGIEKEYILDMDGKVLYQTGELPSNVLTPLQMKLLSDNYDEEYTLRKHNFINDDGDEYTLLLFLHQNALEAAVGHSWKSFFTIFGLAYMVLVLLFILVLKRRIQRPLQLLGSQLNSFASGDVLQSDYCGPGEFVDIFESFYSMSLRLKESEERRKHLEEDKQRILADISHDLKTPITVVHGYAKALCDGVVPKDETYQYLKTIEQKSNGLNELINTFFEYSKMDHPDYSLSLSDTDICNYLRDYIAEHYAELELNGFHIQVDIPEEHIFCKIDSIQLKRVFENIVSNAVKHNSADTTLFFSLMHEKENVHIVIADNGIGIPTEKIKDIFEPFVVGDCCRGKHGSGLGLSIAKKIIEAHHGSIGLMEPRTPYNTAFEIILPTI